MAYREIIHYSSNESTDSDDDETYWKRRKTKGESHDHKDHNKSVKPCNRVWLNVTNEHKLDSVFSATNIEEKQDLPKGSDGYFVDLDSVDTRVHQLINKPKRTEWDEALFGKDPPIINWNRNVSRAHIGVNFFSSPGSVVEEIIIQLKEPNHDLIAKVVENLGVKRALEYYYLTEDIEQSGGMFLKDGSRRRSPGGVYLNLIKISPEVKRDERKAIFLMDRQIKDKLKRKRREYRKHREKSNQKQFGQTDSDSTSIPADSHESTPICNQELIPPNTNHDETVLENHHHNQSVNSYKHTEVYEEGEVTGSSQED